MFDTPLQKGLIYFYIESFCHSFYVLGIRTNFLAHKKFPFLTLNTPLNTTPKDWVVYKIVTTSNKQPILYEVFIYQPKSFPIWKNRVFFRAWFMELIMWFVKLHFTSSSFKKAQTWDNRLGITLIKMKFEFSCGLCHNN